MDNRYRNDDYSTHSQHDRAEERTVYEVIPSSDNNQELEAVKRRPSGSDRGQRGRGIFPAFMAGALLIGSLMFASDHYNLFTGDSTPVQGANSPRVENVSYSSPSGTGSVADIAEQAGPAVVRIGAESRASNSGFGWYGMQGGSSEGGDLVESGLGTGFVFDPEGYILTNEHVIHGAEQVKVTLQGYDEPFVAQVVGSSYELDLAVLKIEGETAFPYLELGESDQMKIGEWVVAIGNPYDLDYTVTTGVLSASERSITIPDQEGTRNYKHLLQTDTAINPGNSGGPLLNMKGQVIGINTAVSSDAQGIGFAIPTSTIKSVLDNLLNDQPIPSPYIGVSLQDLTPQMRGNLGLSDDEGVGVAFVQEGDPAAQAGLQPGDIIIEANGEAIGSTTDLTELIQSAQVGGELKLTVVRNEEQLTIDVRIGDRNQTTTIS
ncbi:S1C family serine protease [Paenibacillus daejeonensis]|uniref:S1C family serine protease n=1 Tax=Paenibacillus daejeonensis TaxID=135193 RepID=UPI000366499A|nr:trypsin-like peptidase domain-containing protein [Paenibacillus daejeonensis]